MSDPVVECTVRVCPAKADAESSQEKSGSVYVKCLRCGHSTTSFGASDKSIRRCLILLRLQCRRGERNFYARQTNATEIE